MKKTILALAIASTLSAPASAGFSFGDLADKAKSIGGDVLEVAVDAAQQVSEQQSGPALPAVITKDQDCTPYVDYSEKYSQCREQRSIAMKQYQEDQRAAKTKQRAEAEANRQADLAAREETRRNAEVAREQEKQDRVAKQEAQKNADQAKALSHIDSLTLMSKDELASTLESGIPGRVASDDASFDIGFIVKIDGVQLSKDYRFKGEVVCFDEWDDQVGRDVEMTGDVVFDTSGQMEFNFGSIQNVEQKKFAGTWVVAQWNILDMRTTYLESKEIVECRFDSLRIK
jgi:hypothetical protein